MDKTGVDVQALTINGFWWYEADRDLAQPHRAGAERGAREVGLDASRSLRRDGLGGAAASRSRGAAARGRRQASRPARRVDRRARERRRSLAAEVRPVLGQGRRARRARRHASRRRGQHHQGRRAARPRRSRQHHRQPARDDLLPLAIDLRRHVRQVPGASCLRRARRRLSAVISRQDRSRVRRPRQRQLRQQAQAERDHEEAR